MKTEEKNTKRWFRRGNVLDLAIILLLVAALVAIGYRYYQIRAEKAEIASAPDRARVTFEIKALSPTTAAMLERKDMVYLSDDSLFGKLVAHPKTGEESPLLMTDAILNLRDQLGKYVSVTVPKDVLCDVTGILECNGITNDQGDFLINETMVLTPGQTLTLHTERVEFTLTITAIELQRK